MSENNSSSPMAFTSVLALIFITLKLTNYISWSWWWVLAPIVLRLGVCAACTNFKITHSLDSGITPSRCYV